MDVGVCSIIVALITGICSIITAIIWGYIPKQRKVEIQRLRKELLDVYVGAYNLKIIEDDLEKELGISRSKARKGIIITEKLERARIEKRINQLQSMIEK